MINLVYSRRLGDPLLKAFCLCLADKADDEGRNAFPSIPTVADETDMGESTTRKQAAKAKSRDLIDETGIKPIGNGGFVKVYAFNLPVWLALPVVKSHERHADKYAWAADVNPLSHRDPPLPKSAPPSLLERTPLSHRDPIPLEPQINPIAAAAVDYWNQLADQNGRQAIKKLSDKRNQRLLSAIHHIGGIDAWEEAVTALAASEWIRHAKPKGFDFDSLVAMPDRLIGLIEGKFSEHANPSEEIQAERRLLALSAEELAALKEKLPSEGSRNHIDSLIRRQRLSEAKKGGGHPLTGAC